MNENQKRLLFDELEQLGMRVAEMCVMSTLLNHPRLPEDLAQNAEFEWRGDNLEQPSEVYKQAVESCQKKGWVMTVTEQEHAAQADLLASQMIPIADDGVVAEVGTLDLTSAGYGLLRKATEKRLGTYRHGARYVTAMSRVEIYSDSENDCRAYASWFLQNKVDCFYGAEKGQDIEVEFLRIDGPVTIGPWRYNRFEVVPQGFLMILQYARKTQGSLGVSSTGPNAC